jgi:hypothetical protein
MKKIARGAAGFGCLSSILAPILAIILYPRANWLFAFVLIGVIILALIQRSRKDPAPRELADEIERLLTGNYGGWDVDNFEHRGIRDPRLKELWLKSMQIGGLPEEWVNLNPEQKDEMRALIGELRGLETIADQSALR